MVEHCNVELYLQRCQEALDRLDGSAQWPVKVTQCLDYLKSRLEDGKALIAHLTGTTITNKGAAELRSLLQDMAARADPFLDTYFGRQKLWVHYSNHIVRLCGQLSSAALSVDRDGEQNLQLVYYPYMAKDNSSDIGNKPEDVEKCKGDPDAIIKLHPALPSQYRPYDANSDFCSGCWECTPKLLSCGRCSRVKYCNKECQRHHWRLHKTECIEWSKDKLQEKESEITE